MKNKIEEQSRRLNAARRAASKRAADTPLLRFAIGDDVKTRSAAPSGYRNRHGVITEIGAGGTEYRVEFEDGLRPTTAYLLATWLEH